MKKYDMHAMERPARPRSSQGIVVGAAASSSASRVLSSSSGVDDVNGKSRKASTRQKASAI
jgi:hypothetical protein